VRAEAARVATPLGVIGLAIAGAVVLTANHPPARLLLAFAALGPGAALVVHARRLDAVTALALAGLTSLTVTTAVTVASVRLHRWAPSVAIAVVAGACAVSCLVGLVRVLGPALAWLRRLPGALARRRTTRLSVSRPGRRSLILWADVPRLGSARRAAASTMARSAARLAVPAQRTSGSDTLPGTSTPWQSRVADGLLLAGLLGTGIATLALATGAALVVTLVASVLLFATVWSLRPHRRAAILAVLAFTAISRFGLAPGLLEYALGLGAVFLVVRFLRIGRSRRWRFIHSGLSPAPPVPGRARYAAVGGLAVVLGVLATLDPVPPWLTSATVVALGVVLIVAGLVAFGLVRPWWVALVVLGAASLSLIPSTARSVQLSSGCAPWSSSAARQLNSCAGLGVSPR
jgi:hypothetical protein